MRALRLHENEPGCSVLQFLEAIKVFLRDTVKDGTTIIHPGQDKRPNSIITGIKGKKSPDAIKIINLPIQGARNRSNMVRHTQAAVKDHSKILNGGGRAELKASNMESEMLEDSVMEMRRGNKELSLGII